MKKTMALLNWVILFAILTVSAKSLAQANVMNPGLAYGQIVVLSTEDMEKQSEKYLSLNALSIPVFAELPMELAVIAGTITLRQQNHLSHVQIKARARKTPNLDISALEGGLDNEMFQAIADGDWVRLELARDGVISITPSSKEEATAFYKSRVVEPVTLQADLKERTLFKTADMGWKNFDSVGSKTANYAELAKALNTDSETYVRAGFGIPFYYYQQFIDDNPQIQQAITKITRDPLARRIEAVRYREGKLKIIRDMIQSETAKVDDRLVEDLVTLFDSTHNEFGALAKMKLRSSTNAEDLPNFNGAGLYTSASYKPYKKRAEREHYKKKEKVIEALKEVWGSVWNSRAFEEREYFAIAHEQVKMGIQINPSFVDEAVDGVVVTTNVANDERAAGKGVYIEAQRGDNFSVANPEPGVQPDRIFVSVDKDDILNIAKYKVMFLHHSNISDDTKEIMDKPNPSPTMTDEEAKEIAYQSLKAEVHFKPLLGADNPDFSLDLEFKIAKSAKKDRQVFFKQARPFIQ